MPRRCDRLRSTWRIWKSPARRCGASSASGSAPAICWTGRRNSPPDFFGDAVAYGCEVGSQSTVESSMTPQLFPLGPDLSTAGQLDRADIDALAAAGVRTIINNRPDGEDPGQLPAAEARRIAEAHGLAYYYIPITAATLSRADVDAFAAVLHNAPGAVVAHCRSVTRSALVWALTLLRG